MLRSAGRIVGESSGCLIDFLNRRAEAFASIDRNAKGFLWPVAGILVVVFCVADGRIEYMFNAKVKPVAAVEFLKKEPIKGNMFDNDEFGAAFITTMQLTVEGSRIRLRVAAPLEQATTTSLEAFKAYDLWGAEFFGLRDFVLVPAREDPALLDFPNLAKRPEDERYLLASTGDVKGQMKLDLLQLVPLTPEQWQRATAEGSARLLESLDWKSKPPAWGWSAIRPVA